MVPIATAAAGYVEHEPIIWIIMATALTAMATVIAGLAIVFQMGRKNPANKLQYFIGLGMDLLPEHAPAAGNRAAVRKAKSVDAVPVLGPTQLQMGVSRKISKAQIGLELVNASHIPISCYTLTATTALDGLEPGRSKYPKPPFLLIPGARIRMYDDLIDMEQHPAGRKLGHIDMTIRYGHKGRETNELRVAGNVNVIMEHYGFVSQILLEHVPPTA